MILNKLQILLESWDLTAYTLAKDLLLYPQTIYQLAKKKKRIPKKDILDLICIYFDCDVDDVLKFVPTIEVNHNEISAKPWDNIDKFQKLFNPKPKC
jgi:DNA-binding Xre family transcriptional regulator